MSQTLSCPSCQTHLSPLVADGQCPRCLVRLGRTSEDEPRLEEPPGVRAGIAPHLLDFELQECLGIGGMGVVYRAHHLRLDRSVAIKVLLPAPQERELWRGRFEREARALARLNHPNIISVFDFGSAGDYSYLVMEYVEGANLRQLLREGQLEVREALAIAPQLCHALQYAHDEGVVHRDIKPENILMDLRGHVKIADFGLAKILGDSPLHATLTGSRQAMGTLRYMAPEQIDHPRQVDQRADIFSLGVVLYEMLTGRVPAGRFEAPSQLAPVNELVDEVVLRALEREPERRYQSVLELERGLIFAREETGVLGLESQAERTGGAGREGLGLRAARARGRSRLFGAYTPTRLYTTLGIPEDANLFTLGASAAGLAACLLPGTVETEHGLRSLISVPPTGLVLFAGFLIPLVSLERAKWNTGARRFQWTRLIGAFVIAIGYATLEQSRANRLTEVGEAVQMIQLLLMLAMAGTSIAFLARGRSRRPSRPSRWAVPRHLSERFTKAVVSFALAGLLGLLLPWQANGWGGYYQGFATIAGMTAGGAFVGAMGVRAIFHGLGFARLKGLLTTIAGSIAFGSSAEFSQSESGVTAAAFLAMAFGALILTIGLAELLFGVQPLAAAEGGREGEESFDPQREHDSGAGEF